MNSTNIKGQTEEKITLIRIEIKNKNNGMIAFLFGSHLARITSRAEKNKPLPNHPAGMFDDKNARPSGGY